MGDRPAEGPGLGPLDVDVDPLVVAGGIGELVDPLLGDLERVAVAEVLTGEAAQLVEAVDHAWRGHRRHSATPATHGFVTDDTPNPDFRCGFVTLVGRPNVGKSSLINAICGAKVSIVSDKPQTTRHRIRGIFNAPRAQLVFVDTPGLHKPVTALGRKVNATAIESVSESDAEVDVVCLVLDATAPFGSGDRWVADHLAIERAVVIVNKIDRAVALQGAGATRCCR